MNSNSVALPFFISNSGWSAAVSSQTADVRLVTDRDQRLHIICARQPLEKRFVVRTGSQCRKVSRRHAIILRRDDLSRLDGANQWARDDHVDTIEQLAKSAGRALHALAALLGQWAFIIGGAGFGERFALFRYGVTYENEFHNRKFLLPSRRGL